MHPDQPQPHPEFEDSDENRRNGGLTFSEFKTMLDKKNSALINLLSENNSFKKTLNCPHINLNHLITNCKNNKDEKIFRLACTQRIRHKQTTIVLYIPRKE